VDDLRFDDAHQAFLSKLSGTTVMQRLEMGEKSGGGVEQLRAAQLKDALYVKQNWTQFTDEEKTAMTGVKSKVSWNFTIRGRKHIIVFEYGSLSGKKKVALDGQVLIEKKPSLLSANKHKRFSHKFEVDGVECEVSSEKVSERRWWQRVGGGT
jgi:hypothetical protein